MTSTLQYHLRLLYNRLNNKSFTTTCSLLEISDWSEKKSTRKRNDRDTVEKVGCEGQRGDSANAELDRANILRVLRRGNN